MKRIFNGSGGRKAALILSLCLIFALAVGTTLAYLKANTSPVTNTFKAATSEIKIEEKTDVLCPRQAGVQLGRQRRERLCDSGTGTDDHK